MKINQKLLLSLSTILLLITSLVTTTVAWFKLDAEATIDNFDFNLVCQQGILVSLDGGANYVKTITKDDIKAAIVVKYKEYTFNYKGDVLDSGSDVVYNFESDKAQLVAMYDEIVLQDVTSSDGRTFSTIHGLTTELTSSTNVVTESSGMYYSFDLYFTVDTTGDINTITTEGESKDRNIYFGLNTGITGYSSTLPILRRATGYSKVAGENVNIGDAIEYSKNNSDLTTNTITVNSVDAFRFSTTVYDSNTIKTTKIYELSEGLGSYATDQTDETLATYDYRLDSTKNFGFTYINNGERTVLPLEIGKCPDTFKTLNEVKTVTGSNTTLDGRVVDKIPYNEDKKSYEEQKVTFNIWFEGYDADCFDGVGAKPITASFYFSLKKDSE